ncbi:endonuclease III [Aerococcus urinaehominis]|uniref:Endonuclease III n=1 Tax=Aerococcus urinaehominis TaxID=128944 RepID=A0A0X8FKF5_9LACT|nr:endonuclease III [Aerococcus urinaehominis]AMB98945.1 endonuclease III [Aerococcus urinaehominis]SDM40738.1 DNA-(apurinic or apyrimidinic site) lyase /endonuclease III [Aerococcus urinaehominis]
MLSDDCARYVLREIMSLYPNAQTILKYHNTYELLVAVMLSAQTTDIAVNKVTPALFQRFPTPYAAAQASAEEIEPYLKSIGLYRNKAKYMYEISCQLVDRFAGQVPNQRKDLESLSGVGRKTASVVLSVAFKEPAFPVDTHISRVCKHHKIVPAKATVRQVEDRVVSLLDPEELHQAHHALIFFGREVCHPRNPECHKYPELYQCQEEIPDK